jgi:hypothetical protein
VALLAACGLDDSTKTRAGCTALAWVGAPSWQVPARRWQRLLAIADEVIE